MPFYFAYGSNMSPPQMCARCPGARAVGRARLEGWQFIIAARGGANIVPRAGARVEGVLWQVRREHLVSLNGWEGVAQGVYRRGMIRVTLGGRSVTAVTYISDRRWPGRARVNYLTTAILPGAEEFSLDLAYRGELAAWLGRRPVGPRTQRYVGRRNRQPGPARYRPSPFVMWRSG